MCSLEELSLKELVKILYKYRVLIIRIVLIFVAFSFIYSYFIAVPMYQVQVECEIKGANTGVDAFEQDNYPIAITDAIFKELKDFKYMEQVSKILLNNNVTITGIDLSKIISFNKGPDNKSIIVSARYKSKKEVVLIANTAADVLSRYSSNYLKERLQQYLIMIEDQIELGKSKVEEALSQYENYLAGSESISELQEELDMNKMLLVQLKANLNNVSNHTGKSKTQLEKDIIDIENKIQSLKKKLRDENHRDKLYSEDLESLFSAYNSLGKEYNRLKLAELYLETKSNVSILSYAAEPESASWPNIKFIAAVSMTLGILISFFTAFTIEYFKLRK